MSLAQLLLLGLLSQQAAGHVALVVGNNDGGSQTATLRHAHRDAELVRDVLTDVANATVVMLTEPTVNELDRYLRQLAGARRMRPRRLTFFYAGHADDQHLHLGHQRYSLRRLASQLAAVNARLTLVVIDGCRGDTGRTPRGLERVAGSDVDVILRADPSGSVWIRSTSQGEAAQESDLLGGGIFTHYWVTALRGAADKDQNHLVTLSEAYAYAAARTEGFSAAGAGILQSPSFDMDLSGSRDPVLARTGVAPSRLELPAWSGAVYVVRRLPSGAALLTVHAREKQPLWVGLPTGRFQVLSRTAAGVFQQTVELPWGGAQRLSLESFSAVPTLVQVSRRGLPAPPAELLLAIQGGMGLELDRPATSQRLSLGLTWSLPGAYTAWRLGLAVGWTGNDLNLSNGDWVRSDAWHLEVAGMRLLNDGILVVACGLATRAEVVWQRQRLGSIRYRDANIAHSPQRQGFRGGALVLINLEVPLAWGLMISSSIGVGLIVEQRSAGIAAVPRLEASAGPGLVW